MSNLLGGASKSEKYKIFLERIFFPHLLKIAWGDSNIPTTYGNVWQFALRELRSNFIFSSRISSSSFIGETVSKAFQRSGETITLIAFGRVLAKFIIRNLLKNNFKPKLSFYLKKIGISRACVCEKSNLFVDLLLVGQIEVWYFINCQISLYFELVIIISLPGFSMVFWVKQRCVPKPFSFKLFINDFHE